MAVSRDPPILFTHCEVRLNHHDTRIVWLCVPHPENENVSFCFKFSSRKWRRRSHPICGVVLCGDNGRLSAHPLKPLGKAFQLETPQTAVLASFSPTSSVKQDISAFFNNRWKPRDPEKFQRSEKLCDVEESSPHLFRIPRASSFFPNLQIHNEQNLCSKS